ncbi:MAG: nitrogenase-stabilizing/protective protein NifW [Frankia sp.]|nr:nitrogenase-stabilizing/protective protein NifW [Frankia sp.]
MANDLLRQFQRCSTAEEYFSLLDVPYDPRVVNVHRLHILRYFAQQLEELHARCQATDSPEHVLGSYRDALIRSYQAFTTGTALDHRLFKVLRDHAPRAFVPTTDITIQKTARNSARKNAQDGLQRQPRP